MPAQLVAVNEGENILVDKPILLVGRHPECDIQIESRKISRRHCCIAQVDDYLVIRDLGSTNGVRINGDRVTEGRLRPSDELTIGNSRYVVNWDSAIVNGTDNQGESPRPRVEVSDDVDVLLESADDPVALPEPGAKCAPDSQLPADGGSIEGPTEPRTAIEIEEEEKKKEQIIKEVSRHGILPDNLSLAPISDEFDPPTAGS